MNVVGSRWWKFDFHNHTPMSDDYGKGPDQANLKKITPQDWLLNYMRSEIDCVAITDHNSGEWVDVLKSALQDLYNKKHPDFRRIVLFPGVELTAHGNIHVLAIFSPDTTTADINTLLGAVGYFSTKGKSDGCTESTVSDIIRIVNQLNGIAIPAHVDQPSGLFSTFTGTTLVHTINSEHLFCIEISNTQTPKPGCYKDKEWAEVLGSDSHHPNGAIGQHFPGSHFTWIKMAEPSFDGLKLALMDGNLSIKRSDETTNDPNHHSSILIEDITVKNAKYLGKGQDFHFQFNPWLNTIIGGRGTGKSTVFEFIRLTLDRKEEIPQSLEEDFRKYNQASTNRHDEGLLQSTTQLCVNFIKDDRRFKVTWDESTKKHTIEEFTPTGYWQPSIGIISKRFPVRIYSQKQIFELAKHPAALLTIIDDSSAVNIIEWSSILDKLIASFLSNRAAQRVLETEILQESAKKGELDDIRRKIEVFERTGHAEILKSYQLAEEKLTHIKKWEKAWVDCNESVKNASDKINSIIIAPQAFNPSSEADQEFLLFQSTINERLLKAKSEIKLIYDGLLSEYNKWVDESPNFLIHKNIKESQTNYYSLIAQLSAVGTNDPAAYGELLKTKQQLEHDLAKILGKRNELQVLQTTADAQLIEILYHRRTLTKLRRDFLQNILQNNSYVQIDVIPYGNMNTIEENFRNLIGRSNGGFDKDIGSPTSDDGILSIFKNHPTLPIEDKVQRIKDTIVKLHRNDVSAVSNVADRRFVSHIQSLKPEQIDRITLWYPEDSIGVKYSLKSGGGFKSIEHGSPGQKTAALLAFILSYGDEPLLLDQPEDDLDNHLIYDLIVTQLREIKTNRQIIIVTHNANIVVNGDAENVIALDIRSGLTRVTHQGGLQDKSLRTQICRIMEGGKKAFYQRYRRMSVADE